MDRKRLITLLALFASFFALCVIGLGAFTRLIDAGLGCPDWPGCYGHAAVPLSVKAKEIASVQYPGSVFNPYKAWAEMVHRYFAGTLGILILGIISLSFSKTLRTRANLLLTFTILLLLIYQILLGQWTVTMKLWPIVVTQHLLGGFLILSVLWLIHLNNRESHDSERARNNSHNWVPILNQSSNISHDTKINKTSMYGLMLGAIIALVILFLQISLGAWTSTNYASLSCPDFPFCVNTAPLQTIEFKKAFNLFLPPENYSTEIDSKERARSKITLGKINSETINTTPIDPAKINYEGGVLPEILRQSIQMTHRLGALTFVIYMLIYSAIAMRKLTNHLKLLKLLYLIWALIFIQVCLGVINIVYKLPLVTAVAHNIIAVMLLLSVITFIFRLYNLRKGIC